MINTVKYKSILALILFGVSIVGCAHSSTRNIQREWEHNRDTNHRQGVICESLSDRFSSCYLFTGYYTNVDDNGVVTIIDEQHNTIQFTNMSCIVVDDATQIGDSACTMDVYPDDID